MDDETSYTIKKMTMIIRQLDKIAYGFYNYRICRKWVKQ